MQFSLKSLLLCVACVAVAITVLKLGETYIRPPGPNMLAVFTAIFACGGALLGAGLGAVLNCLWRGLLIGFIAAGGVLGIFFMVGGR